MDGSTEIPLCDNEPIHIPGSIQPHGMLLVATRDRLAVMQAAGDIETRLGIADWQGAPLGALIGAALADRVLAFTEAPEGDPVFIGRLQAPGGLYDVSAHLARFADVGDARQDTSLVAVELEPALIEDPPQFDALERRVGAFRRTQSLEALYEAAARAFRLLTRFDRVLVYRFNSDDAGQVVAEDQAPGLHSFMGHYFPASDIPRQARALYVRNLSRAIPDIDYTPAPLRPAMPGVPVDLRDCALRSVSPLHLQYMANMGMRASASFSLVREGTLWGLVACHNVTPKRMGYDVRAAGRLLAGILSREIRAKEEAEFYRQRLRLRSFEDDVLRVMAREESLEAALSRHISEMRRALDADGVAMVSGTEIVRDGICPTDAQIDGLVTWLAKGSDAVRATDRLVELYAPASEFVAEGAGMLGILLSAEMPWAVIWFRAEQVEAMRWAGNPHLEKERGESGQLNPRKSFAEWVETVRGRSRRWSLAETEAAGRLRGALLEARQTRRMGQLNRQLTELLHDRTLLLRQKEFLVGEVNHRVQDSLELVSSFLAMQARADDSDSVKTALAEAGRRVAAVALVHKRLYRGEQVDVIDAGRYVEELCGDTVAAMGPDWQKHVSLDLAPICISTERAVPIGLVLTELMINVNKYAYGGDPGPLEVRLTEARSGFQLTVADRGVGLGRDAVGGFGSRLMHALVRQLGGELRFENNRPGLRAVLSAETSGARE